jgi:hypothetical protein
MVAVFVGAVPESGLGSTLLAIGIETFFRPFYLKIVQGDRLGVSSSM